jgi:hypothetical protein
MPRIASGEMVKPRTMTPAAKQQLIESLYDVHCRIFDGVDRQAFVKYVIESRAEHTWIQLYKGDRGQIVGYCALHIFEKEIRGVTSGVLRCEMGMLSEYRGGNINARFVIPRVFNYMMAHPGRPFFCLASFVHPSSYAQLARYADRVYPNHAEETPEEVASLMREFASAFQIDPVHEHDPLVCKVGWKTIDTPADRAYWRRSENPAARFFMAANPGYADGHGLLTLAPVSLGGVIRAAGRFTEAKAKRWSRNAVANVQESLRGLLPERGLATTAA